MMAARPTLLFNTAPGAELSCPNPNTRHKLPDRQVLSYERVLSACYITFGVGTRRAINSPNPSSSPVNDH